jgi:arginine decarboxylase
MTGAIPVFPRPNLPGQLGPIALGEFNPNILRKSRPTRSRVAKQKRDSHHCEHLRRHRLRVEMLQRTLDDSIDTLHFDEAWLPRHSTSSTRTCTRSAGPPAQRGALIFATHSAQAAGGISQASQIIVQESQPASSTATSSTGGLMYHLDLAAVRHHRFVRRVGGDDGRRKTALVEESIMEALDFRRAMRKVDDEWGKDWWFKVRGRSSPPRASAGEDWVLKARRHGFGALAPGSILDDQGDGDHTGARRIQQVRRPAFSIDRHGTSPSTASLSKRPGSVRFIMFTIGITKGAGTRSSRRCAFKDDYDRTSRCGNPADSARNSEYSA